MISLALILNDRTSGSSELLQKLNQYFLQEIKDKNKFNPDFKLIEKKTQKNPIQVFVNAIENSAPRDEITVIEHGGARYPQAIDVSPLRRINLALKYLVHGAGDKAFNKKKNITQALAEEIMMASEGNMESFAMKKKNEAEKQADSAR